MGGEADFERLGAEEAILGEDGVAKAKLYGTQATVRPLCSRSKVSFPEACLSTASRAHRPSSAERREKHAEQTSPWAEIFVKCSQVSFHVYPLIELPEPLTLHRRYDLHPKALLLTRPRQMEATTRHLGLPHELDMHDLPSFDDVEQSLERARRDGEPASVEAVEVLGWLVGGPGAEDQLLKVGEAVEEGGEEDGFRRILWKEASAEGSPQRRRVVANVAGEAKGVGMEACVELHGANGGEREVEVVDRVPAEVCGVVEDDRLELRAAKGVEQPHKGRLASRLGKSCARTEGDSGELEGAKRDLGLWTMKRQLSRRRSRPLRQNSPRWPRMQALRARSCRRGASRTRHGRALPNAAQPAY